jgi:LysM repeat protein
VKTSDLQRIVAANPGLLKDTNTKLVLGKKLSIPGVPAAPVATQVILPGAPVGVIPLPGALPNKPTAAPGSSPLRKLEPPTTPKKDATKTYVVQAGDSLQKIAKKLAPSKPTEMELKLASLNGLKDRDSLQAGSKLKIPG